MVRRLLTLNGLAVLGAVIHHSVNWVVTAMVWWADRYSPASIPDTSRVGSAAFYLLALIDLIAVFGVPAFLFVSGYFIAAATGREREGIGWKAVLRRIQALLIPYLIWTVVVTGWNVWQGGKSYSPVELLWVFLAGKAAAPFYYAPLVIQLYLLAPFLAPLVKRHPGWMLAGTALLQAPVLWFYYQTFTHQATPDALAPARFVLLNWRVVEFLFWFTLGIAAGFHIEKFKQWLRRWRAWLLGGAVLVLIPALLEWEWLRRSYGHEWLSPQDTALSKVLIFCLLLSYLAYDQWKAPFTAALNELGAISYGIYLTHFTVQEVGARAVAVLLPGFLAYYFIFQLYLVILGAGLPWLAIALVNRSPLRRLSSFIFG
ncbi:MAG: acyltransferase [Chloroflexi bacterium]|nr:acyltransferase [Chloroflexota bacterium]